MTEAELAQEGGRPWWSGAVFRTVIGLVAVGIGGAALLAHLDNDPRRVAVALRDAAGAEDHLVRVFELLDPLARADVLRRTYGLRGSGRPADKNAVLERHGVTVGPRMSFAPVKDKVGMFEELYGCLGEAERDRLRRIVPTGVVEVGDVLEEGGVTYVLVVVQRGEKKTDTLLRVVRRGWKWYWTTAKAHAL